MANFAQLADSGWARWVHRLPQVLAWVVTFPPAFPRANLSQNRPSAAECDWHSSGAMSSKGHRLRDQARVLPIWSGALTADGSKLHNNHLVHKNDTSVLHFHIKAPTPFLPRGDTWRRRPPRLSTLSRLITTSVYGCKMYSPSVIVNIYLRYLTHTRVWQLWHKMNWLFTTFLLTKPSGKGWIKPGQAFSIGLFCLKLGSLPRYLWYARPTDESGFVTNVQTTASLLLFKYHDHILL